MADEEAEQDRCARSSTRATIVALQERLQELAVALKDSTDSTDQSSSQYCQEFCQTLVEYAGRWRMEEDPLPLVEVYTVALLSYAQASPCLSSQCENVPLVLERLSLSCVELLLSVSEKVPDALWNEFKSSVQFSHSKLQENGIPQLSLLSALAQGTGVWTNSTLCSLFSNESLQTNKIHEFLALEGPLLLEMRVKHLIKENQVGKAVQLAKACAEYPEFEGKGHFKQMYLVCLCATSEQELLMEELSKVDCRDALEMICNLESEGDERGAFSLCSAFLTHQLLQADSYCAWELTLFWSKLLKRVEESEQTFLDRCRQMSLLSKTVFHILFLIKVIQSEMEKVGLPVCIEMCIRAIQMESCDGNSKATICKTISCLLPTDLEVKRACQLTEFLLEPTVDSYYAVETLYNEPDQKLEEENLPIPTSLRCELLLVFKTQWPFDPEFWDWKTLKRHCLALMGEEASIVSSIDLLNDSESPEAPEEKDEDAAMMQDEFRDVTDCFVDATNELKEIMDKRQKNREVKKLREKGFISARFRNWQAYMQYCVLCDKEFLGHRIVRHAQTHYKDGVYSCPICAETFKSKDTLVPHVASHVKLSCKERLAAMKTNKKLANPKTAAPVIAALKAKAENQICTKVNGDSREQNGELPETVQVHISDLKTENTAENTCPVTNCRKGFKFLKNLLAHVKAHGDNDEAKRFLEMQSRKVICQYCRRQFVNVTHLNDHLQVHCGVRPYICIQLNCKASFLSNTELLVHRKEHATFKARCMFPSCGKIFNEAYKLYDHEAQHYNMFTCKVDDCGKVFRSQAQLDSHQEEHVTKEEEECPALEIQSPQNPDSLHSLVERMLSDQAALPEEVCEENVLSSIHGASLELDRVGMSPSIESMLKYHGPIQNSEQSVVKNEPPDENLYLSQQVPCSNNSVIQSTMNAHLSDPSQPLHIESSGAPMFDYMRPAQQYPQLPPYQGISQNMQHVHQPNVLQSQAPTFPQDRNDGSRKYNSDCGMSLPGQHQDMCVSKVLAVGPTPHYTPSAMSQTLAPVVAPLPPTGNTMTQFPCPSSTTPATGEKQRYNCALETCTRNYGNYRSVTKHMKASHPEFYTEWKLSKRNKVSKAPHLSMPLVVNTVAALQNQQVNGVPGPGLQRQNVIQAHTHLNIVPNSSHPSYSSHSSSIQSHALSNQMENILDPIVHSQLGNTPNEFAPLQPNVGTSPPWCPKPVNNHTPNRCPTQGYPSNLQGICMPQMDAISGTVNHGRPSCHMLGSTTGVPLIKPSSVDNGPQPILPAYMKSLQGPSLSNQLECSAHIYPSQTKSESSSNFIPPQKASEILNHKKLQLPSATKDGITNSAENSKSVKRNKRTKWPAIIKDGKYICSRCFREFQSPKSLGGHLSKRSHCKSFDETDLTSDLPSSFLDLLNSEQSINTPQPSPSGLYNSSTVYQDEPSQPVTINPPDSKCLPNVSYPQANLSTYGIDGEQNDEILKQIMDHSNIPDLFDHLAIPQPPFQNSCGPYGSTERGQESSVIQHTGNVKVKTENDSYRDPYLQSCDTLFGSGDLSDPLLSQILSEKIVTPSPNSLPSDHINILTRTEIITKIKDENMNSNSGGQANDGLLAAMADLAQNLMSNPMTQIMAPEPQCSPIVIKPAEIQRKNIEQDVKKKLREQILAGDFQRRHSSAHSTSTETNTSSKSPLSLNPTANILQHSGAQQSYQPLKKTEASSVGLVHGLIGAPNPESFTHFREPTSKHCDTPVPTSILENDVDLGPSQSSANQHWMIEIQTALEKLDLDREVSDNPQPSLAIKPSGNDMSHGNEPFGSNVSREKVLQVSQVSDGFMKPFACEQDNCTYRAMTKDAVLKHLTKAHNYTDEMINSLKKNHEKFAPFSCQLCTKTFTRNSNLRAHCQTAHRLSPEEVSKLNPKRNTIAFYSNNQDQQSGGAAPAMTALTINHTNGPHPLTENITHQYSLQDMMNQERTSQSFEQPTSAGTADQRLCDNNLSVGVEPVERIPNHNQQLEPVPTVSGYQINPQSSEMTGAGQHLPLSTVPTQYLQSQQTGVHLPARTTSVSKTPSDALQTTISPSLEKLSNRQKMVKPKIEKPKVEIPKKMKEKKPDSNDAFSPYRPYRCVHQGCVAAFTIQHNLILHYRAVHQSTLSTFEVSNENDQNEWQDETSDPGESSSLEQPEDEVIQVTELRCQVKDCSRVFQDVPSLLQHYLQLHKFSLDEAGSLMSSINLGRFRCDQHGCEASFTAFWKYIGHVKEEHEKGTISKVEPVDGMFKCDVDGCDRGYATRSNLLRHTMKKHHDIYKLQLMNQQNNEERTKISKSSDGKENIETNKKIVQKGCDKKKTDKSKSNHWTKYGKPSLKTKDEASALCIKKYTLQYPCMIKGCETVMNSERSIMKHYMGHGLSDRYLEQQRSHFIFCKKSSRQRYRSVRSDDSKSDYSSELSESEETADTGLEGSEYEYSKPVLRKRVTTDDPELFDSKPSNDDSSEAISDSSVVMRRKRSCQRKLHLDKMVKRKRVSRSTRSNLMYHGDNGSDSSSSTALVKDDLASFKPMGFEMSFLKFLEESDQSEHSLKRKIQLRAATVLCKKSNAYFHSKDSCVQFRNPQQLTSLNNVKIIVDGAYSDVTDLLLKQLQEMRPTVILEK